MTTTVRTLLMSSIAAAALFLALPAAPVQAGTVKGVVHLADEAGSTRLYQGYWRLENGNVPVQSSGGAKAETVVVLELTADTHAPRRAHGHRRDRRPRRAAAPGDAGPGLGARAQEHRQGHARVLDARQPHVHAGRAADAGRPPPPAVHGAGRLPDSLRRVPAHRDLGDRRQVVLLRARSTRRGTSRSPTCPTARRRSRSGRAGAWAHEEEIDTTKKEALSIKVSAPKGKETKDKDSAE